MDFFLDAYPEYDPPEAMPKPETVSAVVVPFGDVWFAEVVISNGHKIAIGGADKTDALRNLLSHLSVHHSYVTLNRKFTTKENDE